MWLMVRALRQARALSEDCSSSSLATCFAFSFYNRKLLTDVGLLTCPWSASGPEFSGSEASEEFIIDSLGPRVKHFVDGLGEMLDIFVVAQVCGFWHDDGCLGWHGFGKCKLTSISIEWRRNCYCDLEDGASWIIIGRASQAWG
jgi:hypothetical protein